MQKQRFAKIYVFLHEMIYTYTLYSIYLKFGGSLGYFCIKLINLEWNYKNLLFCEKGLQNGFIDQNE